jgi:rod shape-determining protein MreC
MQGVYAGQRSREKQQWLLLLGVVLVLAVAEQVRWFLPISTAAEQFFMPSKVLGVQVVSALTWPFRAVFVEYDQAERLQELQRQHTVALARIGELERVEKENADLRRLLDASSQLQERAFAIAAITSYASPSIGIGSASGIQAGALVFFSDTLLGVVSAISDNQAKIQLLKQAQGAGFVAKTESGVQGVLRSDGKVLYLEEVPRTAVIPRGERVVTVGQEGMPEGMFIGITGATTVAEAAPVQAVVVDQLHSFYDATVVEVLR